MMKLTVTAIAMSVLWTIGAAPAGAADVPGGPDARSIPPAWLSAWNDPPAADRPLQIVHGIPAERATPEGMQFYKDRGLGGIVCNVAFDRYLESEDHWKTLVAGVDACARLGLVVWLYDEEGYPSGAAGGLVLRQNPAFEARELAYDPSQKDPFILRPAYEHTHAGNNFHAARRYVNLIDKDAVGCFIEKTHGAYRQRLQKHFGKTIQAFFTDEPSLIAVNLGQLPEHVRKKVRVVDPIDPAAKALPCVPWSSDLAAQYGNRYGSDLAVRRRSLFEGDTPEDRATRRQFWELIAEMTADRYFAAIQQWCKDSGLASSGHNLWEEALLHHVPLYGNGLKMLCRMDIPGLDLLTSDPDFVIHTGWMTAAMPESAALLSGRRRVLTEVSDFSQKMGGAGPAALAEIQATAAWQAAWGVTEFTLYYGIGDRSADDYRAYCRYVGRLNAVLKSARPDPQVLLYYPVHDLWSEYRPVGEPLRMDSQSPRAKRIVQSFMRLGQTLQRNQVPFALADHEHLATATAAPGGRLTIMGHDFTAMVVPEDCRLPEPAAGVVERFRQAGGRVLADGPDAARLSAPRLAEQLAPGDRLAPPSERIVLGRFTREGRRVMLVTNVGRTAYTGQIAASGAGKWLLLDPASGSIRPAEMDPSGRIRLALAPRQAMVLLTSAPSMGRGDRR
jgi:hypothetical protein